MVSLFFSGNMCRLITAYMGYNHIIRAYMVSNIRYISILHYPHHYILRYEHIHCSRNIIIFFGSHCNGVNVITLWGTYCDLFVLYALKNSYKELGYCIGSHYLYAGPLWCFLTHISSLSPITILSVLSIWIYEPSLCSPHKVIKKDTNYMSVSSMVMNIWKMYLRYNHKY